MALKTTMALVLAAAVAALAGGAAVAPDNAEMTAGGKAVLARQAHYKDL